MRTPFRFVFVSLLLLITLAGLGCSNSDAPAYSPSTWTTNTGGNQYFPLTAGRLSVFTLYNSDGTTDELITEVGDAVTFTYYPATTWYVRLNDEAADTCYIAQADSSVYFFSSRYAAPERILAVPVQAGKSWSRFVNDDLATGGEEDPDDSDTTDNDGGGYTMSPYAGLLPGPDGAAKVIPFNGGSTARVDKIESLSLRDGKQYHNAAVVTAENSNGTTSKYWYVPGYGLTKFVLNASTQYPNGTVCGELIYFAK